MKKYNDVYKEIEKINRDIKRTDEEILQLLEDDEEDDDILDHNVSVAPMKAKMPDVSAPEQNEKPHRKGLFVQTIACFALFISLIYTLYKLFAYNQLHLRGVFVFVVSFIIIFVVERFNK